MFNKQSYIPVRLFAYGSIIGTVGIRLVKIFSFPLSILNSNIPPGKEIQPIYI